MDNLIVYTLGKHFSPEILEEARKLYIELGWAQSDTRADFPQCTFEGSYRVAIATCNGHFVGMGRVISDGCTDAYIQDVAVKAAWRGKGIGEHIVKLLLKELEDNEISWICLIGVPGTEGFYPRIGLKVLQNHTPYIWEKN